MTLNLSLSYFVCTEEYCQTSPNKNKWPNLWHVTSILVCCIFAFNEILLSELRTNFLAILLTKKEIYQFLVCGISSKWYLTWFFFLEDKLKPYKYIKKTGGVGSGSLVQCTPPIAPKGFCGENCKNCDGISSSGHQSIKNCFEFQIYSYYLTLFRRLKRKFGELLHNLFFSTSKSREQVQLLDKKCH